MSAHAKPVPPKTAVETRIIPAGEFKAKCLGLLDEVDTGTLEVLVTKRGRPVARVVPIEATSQPFVPLWGRSPHVKILGDIFEKMEWPDPLEKWDNAQSKNRKLKRKKAK